ncbi:Fe-S-containing hydro-lyase [Candidatus Sumerlaeota bacterium]|nr:Fe-S-containing hydro-lyase [Candidatus Sumerlaeota bacterium]
MTRELEITTPLSQEAVEAIYSGDRLFINGVIYTARDAAHARLIKLLNQGEELPVQLAGQIIFYAGPSPARPGKPIGAIGPTTSYRMDPYTPRLLEEGLKGMIGKGPRGKEVRDALMKFKGVYCVATGGAAALLSKCVKKADIVAFDDLGPEAIRRLEVERLPVICVNDIFGNDLYETARMEFAVKSGYC